MNNMVNSVNASNVYPTYGRFGSVGEESTTSGVGITQDGAAVDNGSAIDRAMSVGISGEPLRWWLVLAVLLVALMYSAKKFGSEGENYANLQLSAYNIFTITLASIIGISLFKLAVTRFPIPGLTTVVLAV